MKNRKIFILAEPESIYLPNLIDLLAEDGLVAAILVVRYPTSLKKITMSAKSLFRLFGLVNFILVGMAYFVLKVKSFLHSKEVFSLEDVSRKQNIPVFYFETLNSPELLNFLVAEVGDNPIFTQLTRRVPAALVNRFLFINKHCSILPAMAGVYPVFWSMLLGSKEQGVTVHKMNEEFDRGPILAQRTTGNEGDFFGIYGRLYWLTYEILVSLIETDWKPEKVLLHREPASYFSFPTTKDRDRFLALGLEFGVPGIDWKTTKLDQLTKKTNP